MHVCKLSKSFRSFRRVVIARDIRLRALPATVNRPTAKLERHRDVSRIGVLGVKLRVLPSTSANVSVTSGRFATAPTMPNAVNTDFLRINSGSVEVLGLGSWVLGLGSSRKSVRQLCKVRSMGKAA
jgi:hypothetical protein